MKPDKTHFLKVKGADHHRLLRIFLAFLAFISIGMPDGLLGVAWPSMRSSFSQPLDALGILLFASMAGYLISSFLSGRIMVRLGVAWLLAASCAMTGMALLAYAVVQNWYLLIMSSFCVGLGAGAIDAGINNYVEENYGKRLMQWLHASYGIGITLGPFIMTASIDHFLSWRMGYAVVGGLQLALAAVFMGSVRIWHGEGHHRQHETQAPAFLHATIWRTLQQGGAWLSMLLFFFYAGAEVALGAWTYSLLTQSRGISHDMAGFATGFYWASFTIGRIMAGFYAKKFADHGLIRTSLVIALTGAVLFCLRRDLYSSLLSVVLMGFAIAPIFPGLVSETSLRVSRVHKVNTMGMQMGAAGLGATLISGLAGVLARRISLEIIPFYLVLLFITLLTLYEFSVRKK